MWQLGIEKDPRKRLAVNHMIFWNEQMLEISEQNRNITFVFMVVAFLEISKYIKIMQNILCVYVWNAIRFLAWIIRISTQKNILWYIRKLQATVLQCEITTHGRLQ